MTGNAETIAFEAAGTDQHLAEAFGERMVDVLNSGALALMLSMGHGFRHIDVHELEHDFQNYWYVCRP